MNLLNEEYEEDGKTCSRTKTVFEQGKTERGFGKIKFSDRYGQICSLQDSSLADEPAIWLGVVSTGPQLTGPQRQYNEKVNARMHLTQAMVKQLLPLLQKFADEAEYISNMDAKKL